MKRRSTQVPCGGARCLPKGLSKGVSNGLANGPHKSSAVSTSATCLSLCLGLMMGAGGTLAHAQPFGDLQRDNPWFVQGASALQAKLAGTAGDGPARNVILFVGSGMGVTTLTAARILEGQQRGESGEGNRLSFERMPHTALVKSYAVDSQIGDAAASMTAMLTGVKSDAGLINVDADALRGDCGSGDGNLLVSALELAELKGIATGIVSTARLSDATPAAAYANSVEREWEDDAVLGAAPAGAGCEDIASQFISFEARIEARHGRPIDGIDLAFAGGRRHFLPADAAANTYDADSAVEGRRQDGRNLIVEWRTQYPAGQLVIDSAGFEALSGLPALGLFDESAMHYAADRASDIGGEPTLAQMTQRAIELLSPDPEGYLLIVHAGRIAQAHAAGNPGAALGETIELARAVEAAEALVDPQDTLLMVTADHSQGLTIAGYPARGNPILGKVVPVDSTGDAAQLAADGLPFTTLGYANGRGFRIPDGGTDADASLATPPVGGRRDLTPLDTTAAGFQPEVLVPVESGLPGGEDVALYARGPGAVRVNGVVEQNVVFHVMQRALGLFELPPAQALPPEARR